MLGIWLRFLLVVLCFASASYAESYRRIGDTKDNVKRKKYPKNNTIELDIQGGGVLNQSYINTTAVNGSLTYFFSEAWGLSLDGVFHLNTDKEERACIENFYNNFDLDPNVGAECNPGGDPAQAIDDLSGASNDRTRSNGMGPAYVPIRENKFSIGANLIWSPIYGKQIVMLSQTNYFDVFFTMGGGMVFSTYYPLQKNLKGTDRPSRGPDVEPGPGSTGTLPGANPANELGLYGLNGRPDPVDETNIYLNLGVGQKFHFGKVFHLKLELRNYTLLFTQDSGFDNYLTLLGGIGVRL